MLQVARPMNIYRICSLCASVVICVIIAFAHTPATETILSRLDSVINRSSEWDAMKRHRISELSKKANLVNTEEEKYWFNKNLYDEYLVYNADSALAYANRNKLIAKRQGNEARIMEWAINQSFVLSAIGLLKEAEEEIATIDRSKLPKELLSSYYNQLAYLFSHYRQYAGDGHPGNTDYYIQRRAYQDSTYLYTTPSDPLYLWHRAWISDLDRPEFRAETMQMLKSYVDSAKMDTRYDAMKAYVLARMYGDNNDRENHLKYLAISAICDVTTANKDIASLEELGHMMLDEGDIDRAYLYINHCQKQAQDLNNRVRTLSLSNLEKIIHQEYSMRDSSQRRRLQIFLFALIALALILLVTILLLLKKNKKLNESHLRLTELNGELKDNISELTRLREAQEETNRKLKAMNLEVRDVNDQLSESNRIKEEYVGQMFSICSDYINKIETLRKEVSRKLKTGQIDSLRQGIESTSIVQTELKDFYRIFDSIFLNLFPDFVKDFNNLLRPEEQIALNEGELLNTPLRIHALIRLGITDSVKIAALLHYSSQTVYNNRLRIRNKAAIPKEEFSEAVRSLGRYDIID